MTLLGIRFFIAVIVKVFNYTHISEFVRVQKQRHLNAMGQFGAHILKHEN